MRSVRGMRQFLWHLVAVVGSALCLYGAIFCCLRAMPKWVFAARDRGIEVRSVPMFGGGIINQVVDAAFAPPVQAELAVRRALASP